MFPNFLAPPTIDPLIFLNDVPGLLSPENSFLTTLRPFLVVLDLECVDDLLDVDLRVVDDVLVVDLLEDDLDVVLTVLPPEDPEVLRFVVEDEDVVPPTGWRFLLPRSSFTLF